MTSSETRRRLLLGLGLAALGALALASSAGAITIGSVSQPNLGSCSSCDTFQSTTGGGAPSYSVPKGKWTITSWSTQAGGAADGKARLRIYRPRSADQFELVRQSAQETVPGGANPGTFATSLKVKKGDRLGIFTRSGVGTAYTTALTGNLAESVHCSSSPLVIGTLVGPGTVCPLFDFTEHLVNASAELTPR